MRKILLKRSILIALLAAVSFAQPALAQKTKAQLNTDITTTFPDNNVGAITPAGLRAVTSGIVNSIMPTAPVVSGNLACFNGTTGLLQDCGSAPTSFYLGLSGDCTATLLGVLTCTKTNGVNFGPFATGTNAANLTGTVTNAQLAAMPPGSAKCNPNNASASPSDCPAAFAGANVVNSGAKGDCVADDTAAFQAALNAAGATGGSGLMFIPPVPSGGCYRVGALNGTNKSGIIIQGAGDGSLLKVVGSDSSGNWWDISGSSNVTLRNLKIIDDGTTTPSNLFLWKCTGTTGSCPTSGFLGGLTFDHVTIAARSSLSFLYAYGFGNIGGAVLQSKAGGGSLTIANSTWTVSNNGPNFASTPYARNAPVHIDCRNSMNQSSAYVTTPGQDVAAICWGATLLNAYLVDIPPTFINTGTFDNNAALVLYNVNAFTMLGGSLQCLCDAPTVIWSDTQGAKFDGVLIAGADGGAQHLRYSVLIGGGINSMLSFNNVFWPVSASSAIAIDQGVGATLGGVWQLKVSNQNLGDPMVGAFVGLTSNGCGPFSAAQNWLIVANLQLLAGGNNIQTCGYIDASSLIQNPGTITMASGAVDNSTHIGQSSNGSWTPVDVSGASLSLASVSAQWTRVGNLIFAYASFAYPSTANGANAVIGGFPATTPNQTYAQQCTLSYSSSSNALRFVMNPNATNGAFYNSTGGNVTNAQMSGTTNKLMCIYPAS